MGFNLEDRSRTEPQWIEYESGRISARFLVRPQDDAFIFHIDRKFTIGSPNVPVEVRALGWLREFLVHHILDWDVMAGTAKAPITVETVMLLTEGMRVAVLAATGVDAWLHFTARVLEPKEPTDS